MEKFLPTKAVIHQNKAANTQEAHEAIRPTNAHSGAMPWWRACKIIQPHLERFIACQMRNGIDEVTSLEVGVAANGWTDEQGK